jgi:hypothetical protein
VAEATSTAWSEAVPVPKAYMIMTGLLNLRGMKYSATLRDLRPTQIPSAVVPSR